MLKCLVLVVLACCMQSGEAASENDIVAQFPSSTEQNQSNTSVAIMNGHVNYQAELQIFHIYGPHWQKHTSEISVGGSVGSSANNPLGNLWSPPRKPNCCTNLSTIRHDYVITPGIGAHKLHVPGDNWYAARKTCIQEGAHLAIINSNAEKKVLLKMLLEKKLDGVWVGIHDLFQEGAWTTVLDQTLKSTGFAKWAFQPDDINERRNCVIFADKGGYTDSFCAVILPFICKIMINNCSVDIPKANSNILEHLSLSRTQKT